MAFIKTSFDRLLLTKWGNSLPFIRRWLEFLRNGDVTMCDSLNNKFFVLPQAVQCHWIRAYIIFHLPNLLRRFILGLLLTILHWLSHIDIHTWIMNRYFILVITCIDVDYWVDTKHFTLVSTHMSVHFWVINKYFTLVNTCMDIHFWNFTFINTLWTFIFCH